MTGAISHPSVNYVATLPQTGAAAAWVAEFAISFLLMTTVLHVSNAASLSRYTPFFASTLVCLYISVESPISGMSMNPARTFGSAFSAHVWTALWIYFTAPVIAMLAAAELFIGRKGPHRVFCAKLHHHNDKRCIFRCNFDNLSPQQ
jgi:aquaporin Z